MSKKIKDELEKILAFSQHMIGIIDGENIFFQVSSAEFPYLVKPADCVSLRNGLSGSRMNLGI